jgi:hypothetical protein
MSTGISISTEQTVCVDCRHPLHQQQEKALSGEVQMVWADAIGTWICPVTGDEHRPERTY